MKFTHGGSIYDLEIGNCGVEFEKTDTPEEIMKVHEVLRRPITREEALRIIEAMQ